MYRTFVDAAGVRDRLQDTSWVVVDCRHVLTDFSLGRRQYEESHIPGAFFADGEDDLAGPKSGKNGRHPLPDPDRFAEYLRRIGVDESTQVVAYDAGADGYAARLWFLCNWIGHDAVAVLDGGFAAWVRAGYPVSRESTPLPEPGTIVAYPRPELVVSASQVQANIADPRFALLDARTAERYAGNNETVDPVAGHIPGARNRFFKENFDGEGRVKQPEVLRREFAALNLPPHGVVHQCGSGVTAAANMLAMHHAGLDGSRLYAGSWSEWIADPSHPVATGPNP